MSSEVRLSRTKEDARPTKPDSGEMRSQPDKPRMSGSSSPRSNIRVNLRPSAVRQSSVLRVFVSIPDLRLRFDDVEAIQPLNQLFH